MSKTADFIEVHRGQLDLLVQLTKRVKALQQEIKEVKSDLMEQFLDARITSIGLPDARVSMSKDTTTSKFDTTSFKEDHPALYEEYVEEVPRAGTLTVYLK